MASNSFGKIFRITTFGESHGPFIGVVIDGCPAGIKLREVDINKALKLRQPGKNKYVTPRNEEDLANICSGVFENKTTGAPIAILIANKDIDSSKYESIKNLLRPGHANYTYLEKYGIFDYRGGGRASARETAARVAAGAIAMKILENHNIKIAAYLKSVGKINMEKPTTNVEDLRKKTYENELFCPDKKTSKLMAEEIMKVKKGGDSIGGVVEFIIDGLPTGLGDPIYDKLDANLAKAMLSISGSKGFEIGAGFFASQMKGSEHNDPFIIIDNKITTKTNHSGGILGGITTGSPIIGRVAFKPTASIMKPQDTVNLEGEKEIFELPKDSRHDPCIAIRAVPVIDAMCALVIADAILINKTVKM